MYAASWSICSYTRRSPEWLVYYSYVRELQSSDGKHWKIKTYMLKINARSDMICKSAN